MPLLPRRRENGRPLIDFKEIELKGIGLQEIGRRKEAASMTGVAGGPVAAAIADAAFRNRNMRMRRPLRAMRRGVAHKLRRLRSRRCWMKSSRICP